MKSKKILLFSFAFLFFLVSIFLTSSTSNNNGIQLVGGRNVVSLNVSSPFSVEALVKLNPKIEVVSYQNDSETVGYANVFGGIGKNFDIQEGINYEVYSSGNTTLILP